MYLKNPDENPIMIKQNHIRLHSNNIALEGSHPHHLLNVDITFEFSCATHVLPTLSLSRAVSMGFAMVQKLRSTLQPKKRVGPAEAEGSGMGGACSS